MAAGNNNNNNVWVGNIIMCHSHSYYKQRIKSTIIACVCALRLFLFLFYIAVAFSIFATVVMWWIALSDFAKTQTLWIVNLTISFPTLRATLLCKHWNQIRFTFFADCTDCAHNYIGRMIGVLKFNACKCTYVNCVIFIYCSQLTG